MKHFAAFNVISFLALVCAADVARAQFNPGPNPISGATTAAQTLATGTGTITSTGTLTVSGSSVAVTMSGGTAGSPTTLSNSGAIRQTGTGRAIRSITSGANLSIQNFAGGTISATADDTITVGSGTIHDISVALTNAGTITGNGGNQGVNFGNLTSGTNSITNSGTITASQADAVRPGTNGIVANTGTLMSTATSTSGSDGVDAQTNTGVQITNSSSGASSNSLIEGGRHGITGGNITGTGAFSMSITNYSRGTIQGDNGGGINIDGINGNEFVTINNSGTITGNGVSRDGDGVDVDGLVNLTNTGIIRSLNSFGTASVSETSEGVTVGGGTITNSGTIEGLISAGNAYAVGRGITLAGIDTSGTPAPIYGNSLVTNMNGGLIRGDTESGIAVLGGASGFTVTIDNQAGATIEGNGAVAAIRTGADNDTINNAGTIRAAGTGPAIDMGAGNNTLNITGGAASVVGDISGGVGGTNAMTINPGAGKSFSYSGSLSNFNSVTVSSGTVTLSGASTYSGNTAITGGLLLAQNTSGSATGSGNVTVNNGGSLGGNGTIGGNVGLLNGGVITPGTSPGHLTIAGNLGIENGSRFVFELGPTSDLVTVGGQLAFTGSGQAVLDITNFGMVAGGDYTLISYTSATGATVSNFTFGNTPAGFDGTLSMDANALTVHVNSVPEPSSVLLGAIGLGGLGLAHLRQRRRAGRISGER